MPKASSKTSKKAAAKATKRTAATGKPSKSTKKGVIGRTQPRRDPNFGAL